MFSGIIEKVVRVIGVADGPMFRRITLALDYDDLQPGESIAVNGVCLTIAEIPANNEAGFDVIRETLQKTNLGNLTIGDEVNIERSLRIGDRLSGHFVQGHVDGTAILVNQIASDEETRLTLRSPDDLRPYIIPKGSIALDGVSLTIASVRKSDFEVALIPTTLQLTTLARKPPAYPFNLEADSLTKTIVTYHKQHHK